MSTGILPHYTATDLQAVNDISVWAAAKRRSTAGLARMIGGSNGTMSAVLRGRYTSSPSAILARVLNAAGLHLPDGWAALLPPEEPPAAPVVCVPLTHASPPKARRVPMAAWEPGAAIAAAAAERGQILKALAPHSSQSPLSRTALLSLMGDTPAARTALDAMIAGREVMEATLFRAGVQLAVLYPVGRLPIERPGPKSGGKGRGRSISIPPSTRAGGGKGSMPA